MPRLTNISSANGESSKYHKSSRQCSVTGGMIAGMGKRKKSTGSGGNSHQRKVRKTAEKAVSAFSLHETMPDMHPATETNPTRNNNAGVQGIWPKHRDIILGVVFLAISIGWNELTSSFSIPLVVHAIVAWVLWGVPLGFGTRIIWNWAKQTNRRGKSCFVLVFVWLVFILAAGKVIIAASRPTFIVLYQVLTYSTPSGGPSSCNARDQRISKILNKFMG